jgi:hypothetical protein
VAVGFAAVASAASGEARMQKWEYATAPLISHALQEILNNWGDEGYELVAVVDNVAYFKRPKA